jgi:MerR family transcriptional regulator, thiopeptide resistance regulator
VRLHPAEQQAKEDMVRTVSEVSTLAGVTVRTLHHYDEVGLVVPSGRTEAGYRLYAPGDLQRLQLVLFYRELGFSLAEIGRLLDHPDFDRGEALRTQRALLVAQTQRLEHMITAVDQAIAAHEEGDEMTDETLFEVFGEQQRELQAEAEQRWGDTDAYRESRRRTRRYTRQDWEELKAESEAIMLRIAEVYRSGAAANSEAAMDAVEVHRLQITERFYDCSHEMQMQLGEGYMQDPRFTATYEAIEPGLTVWVRDAIRANADRATA